MGNNFFPGGGAVVAGGSDGGGIPVRDLLYVTDNAGFINVLKSRKIIKVIARVKGAPIGANITLNVMKNGVNDILNTPLTILAGETKGVSVDIDTDYSSLVENDFVQLKILTIGSPGTPGTDLMVGFVYE